MQLKIGREKGEKKKRKEVNYIKISQIRMKLYNLLNPGLLALQADSLPSKPPGKPL